eukprot:gene11675-13094_t
MLRSERQQVPRRKSANRSATGGGKGGGGGGGQSPMRYCQPLRFSAARGWLTLSEKCPHRLSFPQCTSTLCREAKEKSDWLDSVRLEARRAHDLVQSADKLWRQKLQQALEHSLQVCRQTQARETDEMRKRLSQRTS